MGWSTKKSVNVLKCCFARISVGTMYATCSRPNAWPFGRLVTTAYAVAAATAVFPEPTSPSKRRYIG